MPLVVGRPRSLEALTQAENQSGLLLIVTQRVLTPGDPSADDLYRIGTLCKVENSVDTEMGSRQVVVTGIARYRIHTYKTEDERYLAAEGEVVPDEYGEDHVRSQALLNNLKSVAREILEMLPGATEPLVRLIDRVDDAAYLSNVCAAYLNLTIPQKQDLLETLQVERRMEALLEYMRNERDVLNVQKEIREKMAERLNKAQREALLREQIRTIRNELGEEGADDSADEMEAKLQRARMPEEVAKQANDELKRLKALPVVSAEYHVVRTYLDWLASMPWSVSTQDNIDLARARQILDEDHFGLETVKKRILQFLAVAKLKNDLHGPILCLVGPPGVGKTSLGQSIARALGRKFVRTSLGGVRDEAEIRGHRRTYVGAMPGRIIQSIKRAGTRNPVMMLDEIDKLRSDFHGDPSSAMLEVLDPEQNKTFTDHYLDVPFDLSDVFFISTANVLDSIPPPLRDRMEVIEVSGYTPLEKLHIARDYLLPQELKGHGIKPEQVEIPDETLLSLITHYTREAGVRELRRKIAALLRATAEILVERTPSEPILITQERMRKMIGHERFFPELAQQNVKAGVATGLAWTPHGGDLLFLESSRMPGKGNLILTGQLGDVMKESAQIALSLARGAIASLFPKSFDFSKNDIHVHVPAGAIPKDGPSAGVALITSLVSLLLGRPVDPKLGMTGEITLRGAVLPVGGVKEKVIAALRGGLKTVILPKRNATDLEEVPKEVCEQLKFIFVETVEEVIEAVFQITVRPLQVSAMTRPDEPISAA